MDKYSYPGLGHLRSVRSPRSSLSYPEVVPVGPVGASQWTGHPIGLFIVVSLFLSLLVGAPDARVFVLISLGLGTLLAGALYLWHRSKRSEEHTSELQSHH